MSAIRFWTTPKGDNPHYFFIFSNTETLGVELNNVSCSMFGASLYLYIQKGKEAMKTSKFQQDRGDGLHKENNEG